MSIKGLRHDRGGEYTSNVFKALCQQSGIIQELTEAYTPQQNGVAERANRTLVEMARSMLYHHVLPLSFWQRHSGQYLISGTDVQQADWAL